MADTKEIALLLAEGETAKAKSLNDWLNNSTDNAAQSTRAARAVLYRMYFAHLAAAKRFLELASPVAGVPPVSQASEQTRNGETK